MAISLDDMWRQALMGGQTPNVLQGYQPPQTVPAVPPQQVGQQGPLTFSQRLSQAAMNPAFGLGLGMLSAARDARISPIGAGMQGMYGALAAKQRGQLLNERMQQQKAVAEQRRAVQEQAARARKGVDHDQDGQIEPWELQRDELLKIAETTGDPKYIAAAAQTVPGVIDEKTAAIRNYEYRAGLSPEEQAEYDKTQRAQRFVDMGGGQIGIEMPDGTMRVLVGAEAAAAREAKTQETLAVEKAKTAWRVSYPAAKSAALGQLNELKRLREQIRGLPSGPGYGRAAMALSARYQAANAAMVRQGLKNIATLANEGVRLNPITQEELNVLMSTVAQISNYPEANMEILNTAIAGMERAVKALDHQSEYFKSGGSLIDYVPPDEFAGPTGQRNYDQMTLEELEAEARGR